MSFLNTIRPLVLALAAFLVTQAASVRAEPDLAKRAHDYMQARTALGQFTGAVFVSKGGQTLIDQGFGWADFEQQTPNEATTRFFAGSITKQFTAAAILKLRDGGALHLEDSICAWVSPCPEAWRPITLKALLGHTSGIPDYESALDFGSSDYTAFIVRADNIDRILADARSKPLDFPPGTKFNYSNTGYILLAKVVTKASGQAYSDYLDEQIIKPAGLHESGMFRGLAVRGGAHGYEGGELPVETLAGGVDLLAIPMQPVVLGDFSGEHGDGSLFATAGDLAKWIDALQSGRVISAKSVAEMETAGLGLYGYGLEVTTKFGHPVFGHTGIIDGFVSRMEWYPSEQVTVIVLSNMQNARFSNIARDLAAIALGQPYDVPTARKIISADPKLYAPLFGDYVFDGTPAKVSMRGRFPVLEVKGRFTAGLLPLGDDRFYSPFLEGVVTFSRDQAGAVRGLSAHFQGRDVVAPRTP